VATKSIHKAEYQDLLNLLVEIRKKADLTQSRLAALLGRSQSSISAIENGARRLDTLQLREYCLACGQDPTRFIKRLEKAIASGPSRSSL
jgi:transcriptional regulator with XRE-family HTH domain